MEQNLENNIPIEALIAGFVVLFLFSNWLQRKLRNRELSRQGQLSGDTARIPTIEQRVAANKAWASGRIRAAGRILVVCIWLTALTWNLTLGVAFYKSLSNPEIKTPACIMLGLLASGGLVFIYFAIRITMQRFRFGDSWCRINGKAGVTGEKISGTVITQFEVQATGNYTFLLQCIESYSTGTGKKRKTISNVQWQGKQEVPHTALRSTAGIPFSIDIAPFAAETGYQLSRGSIDWQLTVSAPVKGVDYRAMFKVPVFKID